MNLERIKIAINFNPTHNVYGASSPNTAGEGLTQVSIFGLWLGRHDIATKEGRDEGVKYLRSIYPKVDNDCSQVAVKNGTYEKGEIEVDVINAKKIALMTDLSVLLDSPIVSDCKSVNFITRKFPKEISFGYCNVHECTIEKIESKTVLMKEGYPIYCFETDKGHRPYGFSVPMSEIEKVPLKARHFYNIWDDSDNDD